MNREILKVLLEKAQEELINELCGRRYSRGGDRKFRRAGTTKRTLVKRLQNSNSAGACYWFGKKRDTKKA